jgi:hypothetical protein
MVLKLALALIVPTKTLAVLMLAASLALPLGSLVPNCPETMGKGVVKLLRTISGFSNQVMYLANPFAVMSPLLSSSLRDAILA